MKEIYFIRHTRVDVGADVYYGQTDVPLRDTFPQEAEVVKHNLEGITFDAVYTSPLSRASKLAAYCGYPDAIRDNRLKEIAYGEWEMSAFHYDDPRLVAWYRHWQTFRLPGGESWSDLNARVFDFVNEIKNSPHQRVAAFCHGGILICIGISLGLITMNRQIFKSFDYGEIFRYEIK